MNKSWWNLLSAPKDGAVAVSRAALAGPDIWIDPMLRLSFFVGDRLRAALKKAKVAAPFGLSRCRVLDAELDRARLPAIQQQAERHHKAAAATRRAARAAGAARKGVTFSLLGCCPQWTN